MLLITILYFHLRDSPPNTPQRHRNAEQDRERQSRELDSPDQRRIPGPIQHNAPPIPFQLNIPYAPGPLLPSQNDPFQIVNYNGQGHALTPQTAAAVAALPPLIPRLRQPRGGPPIPAVPPVIFFRFPLLNIA